jgi:hypothetical protein
MSKKDTSKKQKQAKKSTPTSTKKKAGRKSTAKKKEEKPQVDNDMITNEIQESPKRQRKRKVVLERLTEIAIKMQEIRKKAAKTKV